VPEVIIIAGPNGAGKTTFASEYRLARQQPPVFVNADEIARELSGQNLSRGQIDMRSARIMLERIDDLASAGVDFMFETTLATLTYAKKIGRWRALDYSISLIYLRLPSVEAAITRVKRRVEAGGHGIPEDVIRRRFEKSMNYFENVYKAIVHEWYVRESAEGAFVLAESWDRNESKT
jgi:predicted ABC-type ATPase